MLQKLREEVYLANIALEEEGLVTLTWGNASAVDREAKIVVIKPSGVAYNNLRPKNMVAVSLETGKVVEGSLNPSSDLATHLELYRAFPGIGGIAHTHSHYATAWAQARRPIPALGTTHADHFYGPVPCTRSLRKKEIESDYEVNTGRVILETFAKLDPMKVPAVLVAHHAPFAWGRTVGEAATNAVALEQIARMAIDTLLVNPSIGTISDDLLKKHFLRKHGAAAYYGQKDKAGAS